MLANIFGNNGVIRVKATVKINFDVLTLVGIFFKSFQIYLNTMLLCIERKIKFKNNN